MIRQTLAMRIKPGRKDEFRNLCRQLEAELFAKLDLQGVNNFSIWCVEDLVFGYGEMDENAAAMENGKALAKGLVEYFQDCCECLASPLSNPMRLMYEDIGIIREDKSKIRHRVFVTRLKPGCAEEYKRRHDALSESRQGKVNPGPESNFTIWNTGDYIFGYCEIDKSMEKEPTEKQRQATIAWETRMLEIMDWITDDVDWLTGLKHDKIELIFRQK